VQATDEEFFAEELIEIGEIPVFVIFTNYDRFVKIHVRGKAEPGASDEDIEKLTSKRFKSEIEDKVKSHVKDISKFSFCRVGLKEDGSEYHPVHYMDEGAFHHLLFLVVNTKCHRPAIRNRCSG